MQAMTKKTKGNARLDAALVEMAQDFRGRVVSHETADKITKRRQVLGLDGFTDADIAVLEAAYAPDAAKA